MSKPKPKMFQLKLEMVQVQPKMFQLKQKAINQPFVKMLKYLYKFIHKGLGWFTDHPISSLPVCC